MAGLAMAAALAAATDLMFGVPAPTPPPGGVWRDLSAEASGPGAGDVLLVGAAGYDGDPVSLSVAVSYRRIHGFDPEATVSAAAGRRLSRRTRLDLRAWTGLNRMSGGLGGGITVTRAFGARRR